MAGQGPDTWKPLSRPDYAWIHQWGNITWTLGMAPCDWSIPLRIASLCSGSWLLCVLCFYMEVEW